MHICVHQKYEWKHRQLKILHIKVFRLDVGENGRSRWRADSCRRESCDRHADCVAARGQTLPQLLCLQIFLWTGVERGAGALQLGLMLHISGDSDGCRDLVPKSYDSTGFLNKLCTQHESG